MPFFNKLSASGENTGLMPEGQSYYSAVPLAGGDYVQQVAAPASRLRMLSTAAVLVTCSVLAITGFVRYAGKSTGTQLAIPVVMDDALDLDRDKLPVVDADFEFDGPDFVPEAANDEAGYEMGEEIGRQIGEEMGQELGRQIGEQMGVDIGKEIGEEIGRQIEVEMDQEMDQYLDDAFDDDDDQSVLRLPPGSTKKVKEFLGNVANNGKKALGAVGKVVGKPRATGGRA